MDIIRDVKILHTKRGSKMKQSMETYYYDAVSAAGFLTSQMIWWCGTIDRTGTIYNGT